MCQAISVSVMKLWTSYYKVRCLSVCVIVSPSALYPSKIFCLSVCLLLVTERWTDGYLTNITLSVADKVKVWNMPKVLIYGQNLPIILVSINFHLFSYCNFCRLYSFLFNPIVLEKNRFSGILRNWRGRVLNDLVKSLLIIGLFSKCCFWCLSEIILPHQHHNQQYPQQHLH